MTAPSIELRGGGRLAWEETGAKDGIPLFFFHGWPASRLQGSGFRVEARQLGIRIISPDRPGIGLSTLQSNRRLLDWPALVEQLADYLGIDRFYVLAVSGGGPYAIASAWALRDRVIAASIVSGAPPLPPETSPESLFAVYRWLLFLYRRQPQMMRLLFQCAKPLATLKPPAWLWPRLLRMASPADASTLLDQDIMEGSYQCYRESWRGSGLGVALDGAIYAEPWGFNPEEVQVPVQLWHGGDDRSFHWKLAEAVSRQLPRCDFKLIEGEGHYSLPIRRRMEILSALISEACAN